MLTADFDFDLPEELIAQRPAARGRSRLLVADGEGAQLPQMHRWYRRVHEHCRISDPY